MIFTSYHPIYTLSEPAVVDPKGYHRFHIGKTREFTVLWYLYTRAFLGPDEHITIIDQGGPYPVSHLLAHVTEPYDIASADDLAAPCDPVSSARLHVRQFSTPEGIREGVKRLYQYMYRVCWRNNLDMFFIENDCIVTKDWLSVCRNGGVDFATNRIDQKHRACDTYINYISALRLHDRDALMPLDVFLDSVKARYGHYEHENDWDALYDVSSTILNERGAYLQFCYGNVLTFNGEGVMHSVANGDTERLAYLRDHPLDHPCYHTFMEEATRRCT